MAAVILPIIKRRISCRKTELKPTEAVPMAAPAAPRKHSLPLSGPGGDTVPEVPCPQRQSPAFREGAYEGKEPQCLFLTDFQTALSGLDHSFSARCPSYSFGRQVHREALRKQLTPGRTGGGGGAGGHLAQAPGPHSRHPAVSDQTARAEVGGNFQNQTKARQGAAVSLSPKVRAVTPCGD